MSGLSPDNVATPARIYDYLIGGRDNFEVDRRAGDALVKVKPDIRINMQESRKFLVRVVRYLATAGRVIQFLDIGAGIPVQDAPGMENTNEVALAANPAARVVYADSDPVVLAAARAWLTSPTAEGTVAYVEADLRDPAGILRQARETLDFSQPVAVMLVGILHLLPDADRPYDIVRHLMDATPPGSFLVVSQPASDVHGAQAARGAKRYQRATKIEQTNRTQEEVARFFYGLQMVEPGIVAANKWRPDAGADTAAHLSNWVGAGRKP